MMKKTFLAIGTSLCVVLGMGAPGGPASGHAAPLTRLARAALATTPQPPMYAFSDSLALPRASVLLNEARQSETWMCGAAASAAAHTLTLAEALGHAQAFLQTHFGTRALDMAAGLVPGPSAVGAQDVAASAVIGGSPAAALAVELLAHQKDPRDPAPLVSAAALLTRLGMPNEALALLDAAAPLAAKRPGPMGIPETAIALNNRSYALLALHRWQEAENSLLAAAAQAPQLSEAYTNLSQAFECTGQPEKAVRFFTMGARQDGYMLQDWEPPIGDPFEQFDQPPGAEVFDLGAGTDVPLPTIVYPSAPEQAVAMNASYNRAQRDGLTQLMVLNAAAKSLLQPTARLERQLNPVTTQRAHDILNALATARDQPGLHALYAPIDPLFQQQIGQLQLSYWGGTVLKWNYSGQLPDAWRSQCIAKTSEMHARWLGLAQALDAAVGKYWKAYARYATGLAANLSIPLYRQTAQNMIKQEAWYLYYGVLVGGLQSWTQNEFTWRDQCTGPAQAPNPALAPPPAAPDPAIEPCPNGILEHSKAGIKIPDMGHGIPTYGISIKINCEKLSITKEAKINDFVKAFVTGEGNFRQGKLTVVGGLKVGINTPGGIEVGPAFKEGFYITIDHSGVKDFGVKLDLQGSVTVDSVATWETSDSVSISLVGSIDYIPTAFGLAN